MAKYKAVRISVTRLIECIWVYQNNTRQLGYQKLKMEEHLRTCDKRIFQMLPLFYMQRYEIDLRIELRKKFHEKIKSKIKMLTTIK